MWTVLGAPFDSSGAGRGEERAPTSLRAAGLPEVFGARDAGDVAPPLRVDLAVEALEKRKGPTSSESR